MLTPARRVNPFSIVHVCRQKPELFRLKFTVILPELESIMSCIIIKWGLNEEVIVVDKLRSNEFNYSPLLNLGY